MTKHIPAIGRTADEIETPTMRKAYLQKLLYPPKYDKTRPPTADSAGTTLRAPPSPRGLWVVLCLNMNLTTTRLSYYGKETAECRNLVPPPNSHATFVRLSLFCTGLSVRIHINVNETLWINCKSGFCFEMWITLILDPCFIVKAKILVIWICFHKIFTR